jgi:hypothetical protein
MIASLKVINRFFSNIDDEPNQVKAMCLPIGVHGTAHNTPIRCLVLETTATCLKRLNDRSTRIKELYFKGERSSKERGAPRREGLHGERSFEERGALRREELHGEKGSMERRAPRNSLAPGERSFGKLSPRRSGIARERLRCGPSFGSVKC